MLDPFSLFMIGLSFFVVAGINGVRSFDFLNRTHGLAFK